MTSRVKWQAGRNVFSPREGVPLSSTFILHNHLLVLALGVRALRVLHLHGHIFVN